MNFVFCLSEFGKYCIIGLQHPSNWDSAEERKRLLQFVARDTKTMKVIFNCDVQKWVFAGPTMTSFEMIV